MPANATRRETAERFELALLSPATTRKDLDDGCRTARREGFAAVVVRPCDLRRCAEALDGSRTAAGTVVGFPHGGSTRAVKVHEAREAIEDAQSVLGSKGPPVELDLVANAGRVLSGDWGAVRDEIQAVLDVTHARGGLVKAVIEVGHLAEEHLRRFCELCGELGADFIAVGTGFGPREAGVEDVRLVRQHLPAGVKVKATADSAGPAGVHSLLDAGVARIGTPRATAVLDAFNR
ncbi:MAG TPA: deoxyribose-phosphate aldolase [Planctomycetaceae bacterium]